MADTLATITDKINGLNTKVVRNPAANVPPARNSLQATIQNDIPGLPALVRAIVQAIVRTESIEIEPNKCAEISSRIIAKHNSTVAEIIKQFSDSIVNFESTDQFKKIKTYSEKLVEDIIKSFIETEETEQTENLSATQLNKLKKSVNEIIKEVITWIKRSSIEALHQFKLHVTDQLNNKQTESEQNLTEEEIDKLVEKETTIESAKIQFTDLASASSIAPQICSEKLTYGAIKVQTALLRSISRLSLNVNNTLGKLDNILNPVKFMKFVDAISNAGPQIRKALNKAIANNKKNTLGMTNLSEDAIREYLLREIKEQNDLVEKAIANGNFEESRKNLSNFDIFKKASRAKSFNIFKKETNTFLNIWYFS